MTETTTTTETTVETTSAPVAPEKTTAKKTGAKKAGAKKVPQFKLSARQRTNVDQFDNGAQTSAGAINAVLIAATKPLTRDEIVTAALKRFASRFDKLKAPGRVSNHLRHLLSRALVENVNGGWVVRKDARAQLKKASSKKDDAGKAVEGTEPAAE